MILTKSPSQWNRHLIYALSQNMELHLKFVNLLMSQWALLFKDHKQDLIRGPAIFS
jgi:hypothetical protein